MSYARMRKLLILGSLAALSASTTALAAGPAFGESGNSILRNAISPPELMNTSLLPKAAQSAKAATAWKAVPNFPAPVQDNTVGFYDGTVYSAFGWIGNGKTADMYALKPGAPTWTKLASAPVVRSNAVGAFIGGRFYVTGGWDSAVRPDPELDIYDPATDKWTIGAPSPKPVAAGSAAVLGGKLYVIGGCVATQCGTTATVEAYDPGTGKWSAAAAYPEKVAFEACGGVAGKIYCAGGSEDTTTTKHAYGYDAKTNRWSRIADLPIDLFASAYAAANGQLLVQDGVTADALVETNKGFAYQPGTNTWTALPDSLTAELRGGSAPGFYRVGGNPNGDPEQTLNSAEVLAGFSTP
ncbi:MAG: peptidase and in kexin sedolisin [Amycolatopsis sp.]|nr:peptidase and in kexin sedolisin [Amycolatopsis sp.]